MARFDLGIVAVVRFESFVQVVVRTEMELEMMRKVKRGACFVVAVYGVANGCTLVSDDNQACTALKPQTW